MTEPSGNLERVAEILERAAGLSGAARAAYLHEACGDDDALRAEIDSMLAAKNEQGDFLAEPTCALALGADDATVATAPREQVGQMIGRYKLLEQIGEGGFGTVWAAEQREPVKRRVALKVIKLGMDTRQVIARFEAERQALAMMDHPNIAKVLDAGATETGRPYFVMELVKGVPILEYCDTERLDTRGRLDLFVKVCHAIQHAHQKGVIHRDIKPSNVLITLHDGVPVPKVIDFGIAKATNAELTEKTLYTQHRQMVGTPAYMSPEQAEMSGLDIDTRSDVYALGVLLYELLTGTTPFDTGTLMQAGLAEMMRIIREEEPHKPSTRLSSLGDTGSHTAEQRRVDLKKLNLLLRGDLDWIVMKCLEKDRTRRYETANGLAADIQRHLNDEPVSAGPPSARYRLGKLVKRNRASVIAVTVVAVVLVLGVAGTTAGMLRARSAERGMERELTRATEVKRLIIEMLGSINPEIAQDQDAVLLKGILDDTAQRLSQGEIEDELIAAELHHVIGMAYRDIGSWDLAEQHIPAALEIRERSLGADDPATLQSAHESAVLQLFLGRVGEAEALAVSNLERRQRELGPEHSGTLESVELYALIAGYAGRSDEAEELLLRTLETRKRVLGPEHRDTLESMSHLGLLYLRTGRLEEAEPILRESLEARRRVLGAAHPDVLPSRGNLAEVYEKQGRYEEAIALRTELVDVMGRVLGEQHPYTLRNMSIVVRIYNKAKRFDDVCSALETELAARRVAQGWRHRRTLLTMRTLGRSYTRVGRHDDALALYREALAELPSASDDAKASSFELYTVSWLLTRDTGDLQDPVRAIEFAGRAVDVAQAQDPGDIHRMLDVLALAQHQSGDHARAIETQKRAIASIPPRAGPSIRAAYERDLRTYEAALGENGDQPDG
ncbi:MAG: tetratricopeptide repeat protein [Planctomycetes bacterium]|nr:tetratricopeptide repeat protein [Planctomycetota bacterium]